MPDESWRTFDWTKRITERPWHGRLTDLTAEGIARAVLAILSGKAWVVASHRDYGAAGFRSEVTAHNVLRAGWTDGDPCPVKWTTRERSSFGGKPGGLPSVYFSGRDCLYVWNTHCDGHPHGPLPGEGAKGDVVRFDLRRDGFTVEHFAPADGGRIVHVFQVWGDAPAAGD